MPILYSIYLIMNILEVSVLFSIKSFMYFCCCCCSVTKLCPTYSFQPHELQLARHPCPSLYPESAQIHVLWVNDTIYPSHPLPRSSFAFNLSQQQGLFQGVGSSHLVASIVELQLQHQSFQEIFRVDFL